MKHQLRIGMLWGDFPWSLPAPKIGQLVSMGRVARDVTKALGLHSQVVPFQLPAETSSSEEYQQALVAFLQSIDVLWADLYPSSTMALELRYKLKIPCPAILFAGGVLPKVAEAMLFPWQAWLRQTDGLLFTSRADQLIWQHLTAYSHLHEWVVPLSVDETVFYPRTDGERLLVRAKYGIFPSNPLLLYVGRLNIQKNIHTLFYMVRAVREYIPDVQLCLVGEEDNIRLVEFDVSNTGYVESLKGLAQELGIEDCVRFMGVLLGQDLADMYAAADIVVNCSIYHRENFGLSLAEAAMCGIPVVCSDWGGFKDVVQQGRTGYTMDTILSKNGIRLNWRQGVQAILNLLQQPDLYNKMSQQAASYAQQHFSVAALARNLSVVLAEIMVTHSCPVYPIYQPSLFAQQYEEHKRACGWYGIGSANPQYPKMFQGETYQLYERVMQPYVTHVASNIGINEIDASSILYFAPQVVLDVTRLTIYNHDPIWPHQHVCTEEEWKVLECINAQRSIESSAHELGIAVEICKNIAYYFWVEGFVLCE